MKKLLYILLFVPLALFGQTPPQVGDIGYGGVVFHVDEYVHVAAMNLSEYPLSMFGYQCGDNFNDIQNPNIGDSCVNLIENTSWSSVVIFTGNGINPYPSANLYLKYLEINGFKNWYVPTLNELSLIRDVFISIDHEYSTNTDLTVWAKNYTGSGSYVNHFRCNKCFLNTEIGTPDIYQVSNNHGGHSLLKILPVRSFPLIYGCTDDGALNFDSLATVNDSTCDYQYEVEIQNLEDSIDSLIISLNTINDALNSHISNSVNVVSSLEYVLDSWNTTTDLSAGWNMFGYGCPTSIDVAQGLSNHTESIIITKDNSGNVYMPEFGFNGIGDFTPGFGYQIKLTEAIEGFSLCDWYVNDIPEDNIVSLQDSIELINSRIGCTDSLACNFDLTHLYDDGSCDFAEQGFDCEGNFNIQLGDEAFGGVVFYLDETGQHGLVADIEDLGTVNFNEALYQVETSESGGYNDWVLPSSQELMLIYNTIGGSVDFDVDWYWSSDEDGDYAWTIRLTNGNTNLDNKTNNNRVRAIRVF